MEGHVMMEKIHYCERFLELLIDLEALLPTRRFFNTVMDDAHLVVRSTMSPLVQREEGKLFSQVSFRIRVNKKHKFLYFVNLKKFLGRNFIC